MDQEEKRKFLYRVMQAFLVLALAIAFYFLLLRFSAVQGAIHRGREILMPFIYGGVMAYLLKTPCNFFDNFYEKHLPQRMKKNKTGLSVLTVLVIAFLVIYLLLCMVVPQLAASIAVLTRTVPIKVTELFNWLEGYLEDETILEAYLRPVVEEISKKLVEWSRTDLLPALQGMMGGFTNTVTIIVNAAKNFFIGLIICIYALCARKTFARQGKAVICSILKPKWADKALGEIAFADQIFEGFLSGKILDSAIIGLICYVFCFILSLVRGFPNAVLISVIIGITNIIPYFGPFIGAVPAALLVLMNDPMNAVIFVVFIIILQQFDGNILGPRLLAGSVGLSGFWVLFSITLFGGIFGFTGILIGVPVFAVIYDLIKKLVRVGLVRNGRPELMSPVREEPKAQPGEESEEE